MPKIRIIGNHHTIHPDGTVLEVVPRSISIQHNPSWVWLEHATQLIGSGEAEWVGEAPEPPEAAPVKMIPFRFSEEGPPAQKPVAPSKAPADPSAIIPAKAWSIADGPQPRKASSIADGPLDQPPLPSAPKGDETMDGSF